MSQHIGKQRHVFTQLLPVPGRPHLKTLNDTLQS
jgi:hypothetical protein